MMNDELRIQRFENPRKAICLDDYLPLQSVADELTANLVASVKTVKLKK